MCKHLSDSIPNDSQLLVAVEVNDDSPASDASSTLAVVPCCEQTKLENPRRFGRSRRRGAAAVEFAIVAPVFFLFVFGIIEYGRMVMVQQVITNASREGARRAVLDGATATDVTSAMGDYLDSATIDSSNATVSYPQGNPETAGFGAPVEVRVEVPFNDVSWLPTPFFLKGKTLGASTVMRRETVQ